MRTLSSSLGIASLVCLLAWGSSGPAHAAEDAIERKARTHFAAGEYEKALDIYAQLYAETMHPTYLRNIARCHQNLGNADKAISSFREYLRQAKDLSREQRAEVEGYIAEMEQLKRSQAAPPVAPAPAAPAPAAPAPVLVVAPTTPARAETDSDDRPFYGRVWFWAVVAGVAAAGVTAVVLSADRSPTHGNVGVLDLTGAAR